jgi:DNA-binding HxlR family transcriptional regulator
VFIKNKNVKKFQIRSVSPVDYTMQTIGGKWKPIVLYLISKDINRFGLLKRGIFGISKQMLTKQLRELEADGLITRKIYAEIPPRVEYFISEKGYSIFPVIDSMFAWGEKYMEFDEDKNVIFKE